MTRRRSRYAPDAQVRRVAQLAAELGMRVTTLRLGGDGSVTIMAEHAARDDTRGDDPDAALEAWEARHGLVAQRSPPSST